jgi:hypothetical protein
VTSAAIGLAIAIFLFAAYTFLLSRKSATGTMGRNGPGIRIAETTKCEHTWAAAQEVAAPIYRRMALALSAVALVCAILAPINGGAALAIGAVGGMGTQVFMLGSASVRARKAAAKVRCEHYVAPVTAPRSAPPHRKHKSGGRVTPKGSTTNKRR